MESESKKSIVNEVAKVENYMISKAAKISSFNELYNFYFSYTSVFLPTLEFAVNHLNEQSICQLANFGILIDHLSQNQIHFLIKSNIDLTCKEISRKTGKGESDILNMLDDLSIAQKVQLTTTIVTVGSIARDANLLDACGKFSVQNQAILWANIFSNFLYFPILADSYIDKKIIEEAEKSLKKIKEIISDKERTFDAIFALKYTGLNNLSEKNIALIPKYFIGTKLNWLKANEGFYFCKFLLTKKKEYALKAVDFNNRIQTYLLNTRISKSEWSYRNFDTQGPSPNLVKTINALTDKPLRIIPISTIEWLIISDNNCFILDIPSNFNFYFTPEMTVTYKDEKGKEYETSAINDVGTIIEFNKDPADFVMRNLLQLSSPEDSLAFYDAKYRRNLIERYLQTGDTIATHLETIYNKTLSSPIVDIVKKGTKTGIESLIAYGLLVTFENLAEANGIKLDSENWIQIRAIVSGILVSRLAYIIDNQNKKEKENKKIIKDNKEFQILSSEDKIRELYKKISESEEDFNTSITEMQDDGLLDIFQLSRKIREIILSGMTTEEIKIELNKFMNL